MEGRLQNIPILGKALLEFANTGGFFRQKVLLVLLQRGIDLIPSALEICALGFPAGGIQIEQVIPNADTRPEEIGAQPIQQIVAPYHLQPDRSVSRLDLKQGVVGAVGHQGYQ
jgi:hypothetical protein